MDSPSSITASITHRVCVWLTWSTWLRSWCTTTPDYGDQENQRLYEAAPGEGVEQVVGELAQREDEDQVEEKPKWGRPLPSRTD